MTAQQLKNSILQMAVQGKLVSQDPNDEPASVLVQKIRDEKGQMIKDGKIKKEKNPSFIFRGDDGLFYEKIGNKEPIYIEDEIPFEIPESWEWARLKQIVYNHGQKKPSSKFCYIDIGSIDNKNQCLDETETVIESREAPSRARKIIESGDVLYSTVRPYLHNMCIINKNFSYEPIASTGFAVLACHAGLLNEFLFYFLLAPDFDAYANDAENSKGVAYPSINDDRLYKALVPIPPYNEQCRIVQKIKETIPILSKYDKAESRLSSTTLSFPDQLKSSILQTAVQGKLVSQDPNDEPASVLIERIHDEKAQLIKDGKVKQDKHESVIYRREGSYYEKVDGEEYCIDDKIPFDVPNSWTWQKLSSISLQITDGEHKTPNRIKSYEGYYLLSARNILDGNIQLDNVDYVDEREYERIAKRCNPKENDILISCSGSVGRCAVVCDKNNYVLVRSAAMISPILINSFYLMYTIQSNALQAQIRNKTKKTAQANLFQEAIKSLLIPIPPLAEQKRIVNKLNQALQVIDSIKR